MVRSSGRKGRLLVAVGVAVAVLAGAGIWLATARTSSATGRPAPAAQSIVTDVLTTLQAAGAARGVAAPWTTAGVISHLARTAPTVSPVAGQSRAPGSVSVTVLSSGVVLVAARDVRSTVCWAGALNRAASARTGLPAGKSLGSYSLAHGAGSPAPVCSAALAHTAATWTPATGWGTVPGAGRA